MNRPQLENLAIVAGRFAGAVACAVNPIGDLWEIEKAGRLMIDEPLRKIKGPGQPTDEQMRVFLLEVMELCSAHIRGIR